MKLSRLSFALGITLIATVASAQTPNFSGKWTLVPGGAGPSPVNRRADRQLHPVLRSGSSARRQWIHVPRATTEGRLRAGLSNPGGGT